MENASKALIIAGAILISILLISVGIIVMNSINKPIDQATGSADSQAVEMFNSKFTGYGGPGQSAQSVKSMCTAVASSNGTDSSHHIDIYFKGKNSTGTDITNFTKKDPGEVQTLVSNKYKYDVNLEFATNTDKAKLNGTEKTVTHTEKGFIAIITVEGK